LEQEKAWRKKMEDDHKKETRRIERLLEEETAWRKEMSRMEQLLEEERTKRKEEMSRLEQLLEEERTRRKEEVLEGSAKQQNPEDDKYSNSQVRFVFAQ
jgi:hypothetical protein